MIEHTGYKKQIGSFTDISVLMPASGLCGVNLSCGYYNPHTTQEYVKYGEMLNTINVAMELIETKCNNPFEFKTYSYANTHSYTPNELFYNDTSSLIKSIAEDTMLELEVISYDYSGREKVYYGYGETKKDCWFDLFTTNPDLCMNDIIDYSWN